MTVMFCGDNVLTDDQTSGERDIGTRPVDVVCKPVTTVILDDGERLIDLLFSGRDIQ